MRLLQRMQQIDQGDQVLLNRVSTKVIQLNRLINHGHHLEVCRYINNCIKSWFILIIRILTQLDIVDQVAQYIGIPNVGQALEFGAF